MRVRLTLIVLALVILPTVALSLAAGRMLKNWEVDLQRRLERNAAGAVSELASRLNARIENVTSEVRAAFSESLARGGGYDTIALAAAKQRRDARLVADAYLFMNPFGFVYPQQTGAADERLIQVLRSKLGPGGFAGAVVVVRDVEALYAFAPLQRRDGLFAGWRVDVSALNDTLQALANQLSGADFNLRTGYPGGWTSESSSEELGPILTAEIAAPPESSERRSTPTAPAAEVALIYQARLSVPFDFIDVVVEANDLAAFRMAGAWRARLAGWSIALLASAILLGAGLMVREAGAEIRRARARSDFVMSVSHDLRTPVASMKMLAESLYLETIPPAKKATFLATIVSECDRLADMIERVLFFMRQDRGALVYVFDACEPGPLLAEIVGLFEQRRRPGAERGARAAKAAQITLDTDRTLPMLHADRDMLIKLVLNLLDNAYKYGQPEPGGESPGPEVAITARVEAHGRKRGILIAVRDYGPGIARRDRRRIFNAFTRVALARPNTAGGAGLGLSICRDIVRAHGGWIDVQEPAGGGSEFRVWLPASKIAREEGEG